MPNKDDLARVLDDIAELRGGDTDSWTTRELCEAWGLAAAAVRSRLRTALEHGIAVQTTKIVSGIDGKSRPTSAYRFVKKGTTK